MDKAANQVVEVEHIQSNWSEAVEDLVTAGEIDKGILLLESLVAKLDVNSHPSSRSDSELRLASALSELAKLYSAKGFSLKADEIESRVSLIKLQASNLHPSAGLDSAKNSEEVSLGTIDSSSRDKTHSETSKYGHFEEQTESSAGGSSLDDDWEAIADREPVELLPSEVLTANSKIKSEDANNHNPKRRGRGIFSYDGRELYSDHLSDVRVNDQGAEDATHVSEKNPDARNSKYGTHHVLVLADFPPSTKTMQLEELFRDFKHRGFVIRWVDDTTALAVFRTPSIALEALNCIQCLFTVRILEEDDALMGLIKVRDLEPPRQRPQTSARAAQRLIAQGMGLKLPSSAFGSLELKKQEDARRNRIVDRQKLRDEAWGDDVN